MGMSSGGGNDSGFSNAQRWRRRSPIAEINVTPLVDVMLVLLIIFMVAAPLLVSGVQVDLPDARAKALPQDNTPIQISIDRTGKVYVDKKLLARTAFKQKMEALRAARTDDVRVYVRADKSLPYGQAMNVVGDINGAGFRKIALVTESREQK
jgi:biopolymer transport protein TolR